MTDSSETNLSDSMQLTENDGMMDSPPTKETKMDILSHLSSTPTTLYALGKALGISQTALTMQLVAVGGKIEVKDGGLILAAPAVKPVKEVKPRGQMARVVGRLEIAREALLALVKVGPTTVGQVVAQVGDKAKYGDILWVARQEMDKGTIKEVKYGRTNVWTEVG
jgi:biotin operon repressor